MTPFAWFGQVPPEEMEARVAALRKDLHGRGLDLSWHDPGSSMLEAALGRGDRRLAAVVRRAWRSGARMDAWDEHFRLERWLDAFAAEGLVPAWYAQRDIPLAEPLPWAHLGGTVSAEFLAHERERSLAGETAADCHWGPCHNCGVPAATGFACDTGEQGPRRLLLAPGGGRRRWRYMGPPGDPRRQGGDGSGNAAGSIEAAMAAPRARP
jgi:hypothetical protein